jgi:hypothetical protein
MLTQIKRINEKRSVGEYTVTSTRVGLERSIAGDDSFNCPNADAYRIASLLRVTSESGYLSRFLNEAILGPARVDVSYRGLRIGHPLAVHREAVTKAARQQDGFPAPVAANR